MLLHYWFVQYDIELVHFMEMYGGRSCLQRDKKTSVHPLHQTDRLRLSLSVTVS